VARQTIKDRNHRTIGYIEDVGGGKLKGMDAYMRTVGYYDPRADKTYDAYNRTVAAGNVLSGLVYDKR
jgi:hypothetical protein